MQALDRIITACLDQLATDRHVCNWFAKEHDWVSYFVQKFLINQCRPAGVLYDPAQIGTEVSVPQPPGKYNRLSVCRDVVIWDQPGATCWDEWYRPMHTPVAMMEWKVHRMGHKNRNVVHERDWLRNFCAWQKTVIAYAVEVNDEPTRVLIRCTRFEGHDERPDWWSRELVRDRPRPPAIDLRPVEPDECQ
jgi:hypothetical protein